MKKIFSIMLVAALSLMLIPIGYASDNPDNALPDLLSLTITYQNDDVKQECTNKGLDTAVRELFVRKHVASIQRDSLVEKRICELIGSTANTSNIHYFAQKALIQQKLFEANHVEFLSYHVDLFLESIVNAKDNEVAVYVYELVTFIDKWYPNIEQKIGTHYLITLYQGATIEINDIVPYDGTSEEQRQGIDQAPEPLLDRDSSEKKVSSLSIGGTRNTPIDKSANSIQTVEYRYPTQSSFVYYANQYALYYNPLFCSYTNADCQNFASQCVWYMLGGNNNATSINNAYVPMNTVGTSNLKWYLKGTSGECDPNYNWINVGSFANCVNSSTSYTAGLQGTIISGFAYAAVGDVLQVDWEGDGSFDHSYVVVSVTGTSGSRTLSNIWVCAHTTNVQNTQLSNLIYLSASQCRIVHINRFRYDNSIVS